MIHRRQNRWVVDVVGYDLRGSYVTMRVGIVKD